MFLSSPRPLLATVLALLFAACGPSSDDTAEQLPVGALTVRLVDAPADVLHLWVIVEKVVVRRCDDPVDEWLAEPTDSVEMDLLQLRRGAFETLVEGVETPPGTYCETRLVLDGTARVEFVDGTIADLQIPSASTSGFKVKGEPFQVRADSITTVTIDFDVDESLHEAGGSEKYVLHPALQIQSVSYTEIVGTDDDVIATGSFEVPPAGVVVHLGDGATITFPSGSVTESTNFSWEQIDPDGPDLASDAWSFSPSRTFTAPPILTIPVDSEEIGRIDDLWLHVDGERLVTSRVADTVSAEIPHFSVAYTMYVGGVEVQETSAFCQGPEAYWHEDDDGSDGYMLWTLNNDATIGVENACEYRLQTRTGRWDIQAFVPPDHATANACYTIDDGSSSQSVQLDQSLYFGEWVSLGVFDTYGEATVTLTDLTSDPLFSTWIGFDSIRAVPADGTAVGSTLPTCGTSAAASPPAPADGKVELLYDDSLDLDLSANAGMGPVDVIRFDSIAADELRDALTDNQEALVTLYLVLFYSDALAAFIAADGDLADFMDILGSDPETAVGAALEGLPADAFDLWQSLWPLLHADAVLDDITSSTGDLYIVVGEYHEFERPIERLYGNGFVVVADDLDSDTLRRWNKLAWLTRMNYYSLLDEVAVNPDSCSLGKGIDRNFWTGEWTPVPNDWLPSWDWSGRNCDKEWCPEGYSNLTGFGWEDPVCPD